MTQLSWRPEYGTQHQPPGSRHPHQGARETCTFGPRLEAQTVPDDHDHASGAPSLSPLRRVASPYSDGRTMHVAMIKPLQEPTFLILLALQDAPLHGYALLAEIEGVTHGRVRLRVGTLYAALDRLTEDGLVAVQSEDTVNGRLRRTYRITASGSAALSTEADRMSTLATTARARLHGLTAAGAAGAAGAAVLSADGAL
jgi:DNA-binding PadR family transcriptional regulator